MSILGRPDYDDGEDIPANLPSGHDVEMLRNMEGVKVLSPTDF
jgi:hypothetical protein